ncbi:LysE family translocator [Terribacillus saccharophilus]|uniref:LysE family translocator n=1 Tax=Terribacillus saccharophilus TaxID=361277 RepID=UPI00298A0501|nr:LysE family translocator [Terribacillus saccharophilus]MCM3226585.1 LysE family translocator [Terribacillus saccharophilus]
MNITSFLIYCFIVTFTPGPTNIVILSTVNQFGTRKAMHYTYGATLAFGLLLFLSAILNSVLVTVLPKILILLQIIGSLYMVYLAYQIYKSDSSKKSSQLNGTFLSGFFMQFLNPKVIIFTLTVIPSFVMKNYTESTVILIFVAVITIIGFLAFIGWVLFGTIFKRFLQKHTKVVNILMAAFLLYAACMIWI